MEQSALAASVLSSQIISNVPAAVLLSGLRIIGGELLAGVNIGGLGTPVASLASLISLKLYSKGENARMGRYLLLFTAFNAAGLLLLLLFFYLF